MWPCGWGLVHRLALHQPVLHQAEHGFADHLCVAALWGAPTRERELTPLVIPASELQQRGVHLAMPLPLLPQPDPIPRDGVGAGVCLQRVGIAEDGGSPHVDTAAAMVLVDDGDHGLLLSCTPPSGRVEGGVLTALCALRHHTHPSVSSRCGGSPRPQGGLVVSALPLLRGRVPLAVVPARPGTSGQRGVPQPGVAGIRHDPGLRTRSRWCRVLWGVLSRAQRAFVRFCLGGLFRGGKKSLLPRGFSEGCVLQRYTCGCLCSPLTASSCRGGGE